MPSDFDRIRAKVARAKEHLEVFHDEVGTYIEECGPDVSVTLDFNTDQMRIRFAVTREPPLRLGLIASDCVHNARSALDNLACGLVRLITPSSTCHGCAFPSFKDSVTYDAHRKRLLGAIPDKALNLIDELYEGSMPRLTKLGIHPIAVLNTLSNRDKHRAPHVTNAYTRNTEFTIHLPGGGRYIMALKAPVYSGTEHAVSRIPNALKLKAQFGLLMEAKGSATIAFKEPDELAGHPVEDVLRPCLQFIENDVLSRFAHLWSQAKT